MGKQVWKPGNMVYPVPAALVTVSDGEGRTNLFTVAWTGTICTNPPMTYISVRPERYSYGMLEKTGQFVINLTTESMARATDFCGVRSGRDVDKWKAAGLHPAPAGTVDVPLVEESPVNIECRVVKVEKLGSHHMFIARVEAVDIDERYLDGDGKFHLGRAGLMVYSHGEYYGLGRLLGTFGYSVKKSGNAAKGAGKRKRGNIQK